MNLARRFSIEGYVKKKSERLFFKQVLEAPNEKVAVEFAYCLIGSRNRAKRSEIKLLKVEETEGPGEPAP
ncbi:MAG: 50S ribosomal protein L18a [Candidatus Brockarchaeota archaeon]|nr:50S ribosomal protein L18a [Candidatus Brockarchaeota archaeon]